VQQFNQSERLASSSSYGRETTMSIIIPTYNESENISKLIEAIKDNLPNGIFTEIIVVDDNSPDGTGRIVENYVQNVVRTKNRSTRHYQENNPTSNDNIGNYLIKVIHRPNKNGLISAILQGIESSTGQNILIMDADFSHPPETIPRLMDELLQDPNCIVIASRYISGGSIMGWPYKRRILSSGAAKIARHSLKVCNVKDPMSGFFALPRHVIENIHFDTRGYKLLLELLVKANEGIRVKEIPYTFTDRKSGESKLDFNVIFDYAKSVWYLYRYGRKSSKGIIQNKEAKRNSVLFLSKAGRFFTVGASGLLLNYVVSFLLSNGLLASLWYLEATMIGILCSLTSNFFLNKAWTFEDKKFSPNHTLKQFGLFIGMSSIGAILQLAIVYLLVNSGGIKYEFSLILAVAIASISNFLLNKKWTFRENIWG
jgi:dolichol-phosphate mannosyltransferase